VEDGPYEHLVPHVANESGLLVGYQQAAVESGSDVPPRATVQAR
jgi:hypothetical protein